MAPLTRRLICVSFSICTATRSSTVSSVPDDSPASTMATNSRLKTFGCRASAFERMTPPSISERTSAITSARYLSSVCSSSVTSAATTLTPAAIIVANWRANTCSDFGLTFLNAPPRPAPAGGATLVQRLRVEPAHLQLLARRAEVRRVHDTGDLEPLRVDCVICECGHV